MCCKGSKEDQWWYWTTFQAREMPQTGWSKKNKLTVTFNYLYLAVQPGLKSCGYVVVYGTFCFGLKLFKPVWFYFPLPHINNHYLK